MVRLANPLHTEWILEAIQKIKRQKQCPSEERICHAVSASRGLCRSAVLQQLELSVRDGAVLKVTKKGCSSYKDADTPRQMGALQPGAVMSWASSDLRQFDWNTALRRAIESLGDPQGSSLKNIERYLREQDDLSVVVGSPLFRRRLRLAAKRAVNSGRLEKAGRVYRVSCVGAGAPSRCSSMPPCLPQVTLLAHEKDQPRADPIPICSFCFGTKESNRASVPEELLSCADCGSSGHPSCLKFSPELCANVKVLHWQCLDCKTCSFCHIRDKDADRMVFCDSCDRGFHMDCCDPPLARIPKGLWICQVCQPKKRGRRLLQRRVAQIMRRYARPRGLPRRRHPPPPDHRSRGKVADPSQPQGLGGTDTQALPSPPMSADSPLSSSSQSSGPSPVALPRRGQLKGLFDGLSHIYATQGPARRKSLPSYALPTPTSGWGLRWERPFKAAAGFKRIASIRRCGDRGSEAWRGAGVMAEDVQLFQRVQDLSSQKTDSLCGPHSGRCPAYIEIGNYEIQTWYSSAYPREYSRLQKLYICEFCLMYAKSRAVLHRHAEKHSCFRPPADEIYRKDELSVFEVDGKVSKVFCQNLCLLAKLFLEHKTLYYDVEPFLFYVLTRNDAKGCHLVGYFSKEKRCQQRYNVSCIMILPQFQRQGFGHFLIDFSYLLSRCEGQPGSPEKPLSHLGRLSYLAYWRSVILERLQRHPAPALSIRGLSKATGICPHDIAATLQELCMLEVRAGRYVIVRRERLIREHVERLRRKPRQHTLHSEYLRWLTSRGRQAQAERLDQGTSQEEEDEEEASWASLTKDRSRNPPQGFLKGLAQKDILASEGKEDHAHTLGHYLDCNPELDQMLDHTQAVRKKKMPVLNRKWGQWRKRINNSVTTETILETTEVLNEPLDHSEEGSPARMGRDGPGLSHPSGWRRLMDNEENHRHLGDNIVMTTATSAGGRTRATRRKRGWPKGVKRGPSTRKRETKRKAGFTLDLYTPPETPMEAVHHAVSAKARLGAGEGGGLISMTEFIQGLLPDLPGLSSDKPDSLEVSSCEGGVADQSGVGEEEEGTVPIEDRDADDEDEGHAYPTESEAGGMVAGESEEPFQWSKDVLDEPPVMDGVFQGDVCPYESRPASQTKGDGQHELPEADAETACAVRSLMGVAMLDGGFQDCDEMRETCRDPEGYTVLEQSPYVAILEDYTQSEHSSPLSSIQSQPSRSVGSPSMVLLEGGYSLRGLEASPVLDLPSVVDSGFSDLGSIESTAESYENPGSYDSARGGSLCIAASSQSGCSYSGPSSYALSQQMVPMAQCHTDSPQSCRISSPQGCTVPGAFAKVHEGLGPGLFECSTTCYPPPTASFSLAKLQQLTNTLVESLPMSLGHPASHPLTVLPSASLPLHTIPGTLPPKLTPPPMMMRHNAGAPSLQRTRMQMEPAKGHVAMHTESARHSQQQVYGLRPPVQAPTQGLAVPRMNVGLNITPPSAYSVSSINMNVSVNMNMSMNIAPIDQAMNGYHVTQPIMTTNYQGNHAYLNQPPQCSVQLGMMGTQPYPGQHVQTLPHSNVMYTPAGHHGYVNGRLQKQSVSNTYMRR